MQLVARLVKQMVDWSVVLKVAMMVGKTDEWLVVVMVVEMAVMKVG